MLDHRGNKWQGYFLIREGGGGTKLNCQGDLYNHSSIKLRFSYGVVRLQSEDLCNYFNDFESVSELELIIIKTEMYK